MVIWQLRCYAAQKHHLYSLNTNYGLIGLTEIQITYIMADKSMLLLSYMWMNSAAIYWITVAFQLYKLQDGEQVWCVTFKMLLVSIFVVETHYDIWFI